MAKGDYQIPFLNGKFQSYGDSWNRDKIEWRDNCEFEAKMKIIGYGRGRSSAVFDLEDQATKEQYSMFMSDTMHLIATTNLKKGCVSGVWTFCKKGTNYGIQYVRAK
jgi:hypothetical protein